VPLHPAWVKNIARRVLWAALEADITKEDRRAMATFFSDSCAYCEGPLGVRWHADHLLPVDLGGFNHLSNRVPACPRCNEHEKRDMEWHRFLELKSGGHTAALEARRARITQWMASHHTELVPVSPEDRALWRVEVDQVAAAIDAAWTRLKDARRRSSG